MRNNKFFNISILVAIAVLTLTTGCSSGGGKKIGAAIPKDAQAVSLSEVNANPAQYNNQKVLLRGNITSQCVSLCDFILKDGTQSATIFPQGFKFPKFQTGAKVKVYALVTSGAEQVVFSALGMEVE